MSILKFHCPFCNQSIESDTSDIGKVAKCPNCQQELCIHPDINYEKKSSSAQAEQQTASQPNTNYEKKSSSAQAEQQTAPQPNVSWDDWNEPQTEGNKIEREFICPYCKKTYNITLDQIEKKEACRHCEKQIVLGSHILCPYCLEIIFSKASKCKHCHQPTKTTETLYALIFFLPIIGLYLSAREAYFGNSRKEAWNFFSLSILSSIVWSFIFKFIVSSLLN